MCETQCDMLSVAHLCNWQVHPCCHLNCSALASQTGRLLEDETVTVWYAAFINDELIWDELAGGFAPSGSQTSPRISWAGETKDCGQEAMVRFCFCPFSEWFVPYPCNIITGRGGNLPLELHGYTNVHSRDMLIIGGNYYILEQTGNVGGYEGRSVSMTWIAVFSALCHFLQQNILDPLLFLSAFISSAEKCLWGVILIEVGNWILLHKFCCGFFSWQFPTDKCILSLLMSLKKVVPVQWQFSFFSVPLFLFVCSLLRCHEEKVLKYLASWVSTSCAVLLQLYLNHVFIPWYLYFYSWK